LAVVTLTPAFRKYHVLHRFTRPDWAKFEEVFRLGIPMGISMIFEAMLFNSATLLMGVFGAASVAAHQIALNVGSVGDVAGDGGAAGLLRDRIQRLTPPSEQADLCALGGQGTCRRGTNAGAAARDQCMASCKLHPAP